VFLPRTAFQYLNLGPLRQKGFEASLDQRFGRDWSASGSYSWQGEPEILASSQPFPKDELAFAPKHRYNLSLSYHGRRYFGAATLNHAGRAFWSDVLTPEYHGYTAAYTMLGATLGVRFPGDRVELSIRGNNLLDQTIQQHVFGDLMKRSLRAELRFTF
jgi:outer membrane receptor protein involved in Fe transport